MNKILQKNKSLIRNVVWLIYLLCAFFFFQYIPSDCQDFLEEKVIPLSVCGLVSQKYNDKNHNYQRLYYLEDKQEIFFPFGIEHVPDHLWDAVEVGDSIFKEAGSDTVIVKHHKNNSYVIYKLECRFGKKYRNKD